MIQHEMHHDKGVLIVKPSGPLAAEDFAAITRDADGYIESHGALNGLMICSEKFRGWKNMQGLGPVLEGSILVRLVIVVSRTMLGIILL